MCMCYMYWDIEGAIMQVLVGREGDKGEDMFPIYPPQQKIRRGIFLTR